MRSDEPAETEVDVGSGPADVPLAPETTDFAAEFTLFYTEQMPRLVAFLLVHGARSSLAADVAQEAMIEAYQNWDAIDRPGAWIRTVASRTWWRQAHRERAESLSENLDEAAPVAGSDAEEIENRHTFLALVRALPLGQRQVLAWTYDGYRPTEIAALLRLDPATVRSRLRDARAALRRMHRRDEEPS